MSYAASLPHGLIDSSPLFAMRCRLTAAAPFATARGLLLVVFGRTSHASWWRPKGRNLARSCE